MGKYRKKPVVIEAFRLGVDSIPDWFMDAVTAKEVIFAMTYESADEIKTNGDRIRAMSDEEMAKFFGSDGLCEHISTEHNEWCRCHNCTDCIVEWLRQSAEVE